jgi:hypothetical protein
MPALLPAMQPACHAWQDGQNNGRGGIGNDISKQNDMT